MNKATITSARAVKGGKIQIELSQAINGTSLVALLNEGDDRFSTPKQRKAWLSVKPEAFKKYLGIDLGDMKEGDKKELNISNPAIEGKSLNVQINEYTKSEVIARRAAALAAGRKTTSYDYFLDNEAKTAKQIVDNNVTKYLLKDGETIFSTTSIVLGDAVHKLEKHNSTVNAAELDFQVEMAAATAIVGTK
jgi:hypothetical protein